ncbi:hypothetical protein HPB48_010158 [Haemaphysalis longicornis]|uniref:Sodium-dependent multivitamin transporter n=1 Tax=Haemaphysalis longicornis TaxID=44386 RepID=A0A9J6FX71_HAELO|nr:hypothetical protein HPB48_010158 [Haemaphysalis longicornis]
MAVHLFHAADYCVLVAVLGLSSFIGVYFAWKDRRSTNNKEFLVGNRQLQLFPVTMSMMASFLSAIAILGVPSESFIHGSQYMVNFVGLIIGIFLAANVFLPVFYEIDMISANQVSSYGNKVSVFGLSGHRELMKATARPPAVD